MADDSELLSNLRSGPFTYAMARAWGLSRRQFERMTLDKPFRGVRSTGPLVTIPERCRALELVARDHVFSHVTAALLHGLPVPLGLADDEVLHVLRAHELGPMRRLGVTGHVARSEREQTCVGELAVVGLADTWVDFGELIRPGVPIGLDDLVILGDAIAYRLGSVEPLVMALARRVRPRGKLTLLEALPLIRVGAQSAGETRLRLTVTRGGLPEPVLNVPVVVHGVFIGRPDLQWRKERVIGEYQGLDYHGSDEARARDGARFGRFTDNGWTYVEVWADDLNSFQARESTVLAFADKLGVPRDALTLTDCHPQFFSRRMLELAEIRQRRLRLLNA